MASSTVAPLLEIEHVGKRFGSLAALDDVSLSLAAGEVHCLLGENGAGKSTLCNVVFGVVQPDSGAMRLHGRPYRPERPGDALTAGIAMVHQHFSLVSDASVVDNLMLGQTRGVLKRGEWAARLEQFGERYGLSLDPSARIADLSVGERQRVEIVKCLMREPRLLVLDEPTAVLLPDEIAALLDVCERVARQGCGVVLVTHKLAEIKRIADRATVLRAGRVVARSSQPADEVDALVRAMIQRDLAGETKRNEPGGPVAGPARVPGPDALVADGLTVRDEHGALRLDAFTVVVGRGEIVGVAGVEGNGQVELADVLSGMTRPDSGRFSVAGNEMTGLSPAALTDAGVAVVPQDRHATACVPAMSLAENLFLNQLAGFARFGLLNRAALRRAAVDRMQRFDVRAASPDVPFSGLSGGNQQKAVLARELSTDGLRFLLAAQPTRGLDVGAVEAVYEKISATARTGVGVLLISSELDELLGVADRIVVLYRGRVMGECRAEPGQRDRIGAWMAGHGE